MGSVVADHGAWATPARVWAPRADPTRPESRRAAPVAQADASHAAPLVVESGNRLAFPGYIPKSRKMYKCKKYTVDFTSPNFRKALRLGACPSSARHAPVRPTSSAPTQKTSGHLVPTSSAGTPKTLGNPARSAVTRSPSGNARTGSQRGVASNHRGERPAPLRWEPCWLAPRHAGRRHLPGPT